MTIPKPDQNINHFIILISGSLGVGAGFDWKLLNHIFIMGNIPKIWGYEYLQRNVLQVTSKTGDFHLICNISIINIFIE